MGREHLADDPAEGIVVLERLDLFDSPKGVEGVVIELVHLTDMRVRHDDIRQLLHVPDPMG